MVEVYGNLGIGPAHARKWLAAFWLPHGRVPAEGDKVRIGPRGSDPQPYVTAKIEEVRWNLDGEAVYLNLATSATESQVLDVIEPMAAANPDGWPRVARRARKPLEDPHLRDADDEDE